MRIRRIGSVRLFMLREGSGVYDADLSGLMCLRNSLSGVVGRIGLDLIGWGSLFGAG